MDDLLTPDVVSEDPSLPGPARGVPAVQAFMRAAWVAFPDLRFDETDTPHRTAGGDQVAWRWRMRGTMTGTGEKAMVALQRPQAAVMRRRAR